MIFALCQNWHVVLREFSGFIARREAIKEETAESARTSELQLSNLTRDGRTYFGTCMTAKLLLNLLSHPLICVGHHD